MAAMLIPLLAAGGLLYALTSKKAPAASAPKAPLAATPTTSGNPPDAVLARMAGALSSGNPTTVRSEAARLQKEGWSMQAAELLRAALELEQGKSTAAKLTSSPVATSAKAPAAAARPAVPRPKAPVKVPAKVAPKVAPRRTTAPIAAPAAQAAANAAQASAANALQFNRPAPVAPTPVVFAPPAPAASATGAKLLDSIADPSPKARVLKRGVANGPDVASWQRMLKAFGYPLGNFGPAKDGVDSNFGNASDVATRKFQADGLALYKDPRIVPDGVVGPITRKLVVLRSNRTPAVSGDESAVYEPDSPLPGIIPAAVDATPLDPKRMLAGRLAAHLTDAPVGKEDRTLIERFQAQEGVKPTGLYGPGTAIALVRYGIAPPFPRAWSKKGRNATRSRYRAVLLDQATKDPARADEWQGAALGKL